MTLSYYALSSNDPDKYNVIETNIPNTMDIQGEYKMTVISLTTNCNIEVLNNEDFIKIFWDPENIFTILIDKSYSTLSPPTVPYILNELFKKNNLPILCEIDQLNKIIFSSKQPNFYIADMSYNMKLITGFYYHNFSKGMLISKKQSIEQDNTIKDIIDIKNITFPNIVAIYNRWIEIIPKIEPPEAYGYKFTFKYDNKIFKRDSTTGKHCFLPLKNENLVSNVIVEVRNKNTSDIKVDFRCNFNITVDLPKDIIPTNIITPLPSYTILPGEKLPLTYIYTPIDSNCKLKIKVEDNNDNIDLMISENEDNNDNNDLNYIIGKKETSKNINISICDDKDKVYSTTSIKINPLISIIEKSYIIPKSVGYFTSTPILYLLANIGGLTFRNETDKNFSIQSCNSVMIINNSYSPSFPIVAENTTIYTYTNLNQLTNLEFILVDANMKNIKLLNPMYITIILEPVQRDATSELLEMFGKKQSQTLLEAKNKAEVDKVNNGMKF